MSADDLPDAPNRGLAVAKAIGNDVEDLVLDAVDELAPADDSNAHHDAETITAITPRTNEDLQLGSVAVVEANTNTEIKAAKRRTEASGTPRGRWFFKGRDDGQHAALVEAGAMYLLVVYDEENGDREILAMLLVPATIVDEVLRGRWYESGRREGYVAKLTWSALIDPADLAANGGDDA